jgi:Domain of unknown function (DUF1707)
MAEHSLRESADGAPAPSNHNELRHGRHRNRRFAPHAEREATAGSLHAALGEGRLDLVETNERLVVAYAARYRSELNPLLADLPAPEPLGVRAGWAQLWRALVAQTWVSSARARGAAASAQPNRRERHVATIVIIAAALWMVLCLLVGLTVGLVG